MSKSLSTRTKYVPVIDRIPLGPLPLPIPKTRADGLLTSLIEILGLEFWSHTYDARLQEWHHDAIEYLRADDRIHPSRSKVQ